MISGEGLDWHADDVQGWLGTNPGVIDDPSKAEALKALFEQSNAALVIGGAGTGKSTMVNHIANYFSDRSKLFLTHTNPAVDNLKRRVDAPNIDFDTITKHVNKNENFCSRYDVLSASRMRTPARRSRTH